MAEFEEIFEGPEALDEISGLDEMGEVGEGLDGERLEDFNEAKEAAEEQFEDFEEEEIKDIDDNTPETVEDQVNEAVDNSEVEDLSEEQEKAAKDEGLDPDKPKTNLETRLKEVWEQYGSFLKGVGKFSLTALGEYFKWKFIIQVVGAVQTDIKTLLSILNKNSKDSDDTTVLLTNFLNFLTQIDQITDKIDTPLKIITGSSTTTDKDGLANLFANYFTLRASEELTETGSALLKIGIKVKTGNYSAYKALGFSKEPNEDDLTKVSKATISAAIAKLNISDLKEFTGAAMKHKKNLDEKLKQLDSSDPNVMKLKSTLTLPPNYVETFENLETFVSKGANTNSTLMAALPEFLVMGTSPGPLFGDADLTKAKSDFHHAQKDLQDTTADYIHKLTLSGNDVCDMHTKLTKDQFIVGHLKNDPRLKLPSVDLSKFNETGWKIAAVVIDFASQIEAMIVSTKPESIPVVGDIIKAGEILKDGEEIDRYNNATKAMNHSLTIVTSNMSNVTKLRGRIHAESIGLDKFNDEALQTIGNADWSKVQAELYDKFNQSLDALTVATPDTIKDLAGQLLSAEDKEKLIKLWNAKEKLDMDIRSIDRSRNTITKPPPPLGDSIKSPKDDVRIVAALINPDPDPDKGNETVTLKNFSTIKADIVNWKIVDKVGGAFKITDNIKIAAGKEVKITLSAYSAQLGNKGGNIMLKNGNGSLIDEVAYTDKEVKKGIEVTSFKRK